MKSGKVKGNYTAEKCRNLYEGQDKRVWKRW